MYQVLMSGPNPKVARNEPASIEVTIESVQGLTANVPARTLQRTQALKQGSGKAMALA